MVTAVAGGATDAYALEQVKRERQRSALESAIGSELAKLFDDDTIREIDVNDDGSVWVEQAGKGTIDTGLRFSAEEAESLATAVVAEISLHEPGVTLDSVNQSVDGKLDFKAGLFARVTVTGRPAVSQPTLEIRKHTSVVARLEDLLEPAGPMRRPFLMRDQYEGIIELLQSGANVPICGEMFAGKTFLTNACFGEIAKIDPERRVGVIEFVREIVNPLKNKKMVLATQEWPIARWCPKLIRWNLRSGTIGETSDGHALNHLITDIWQQLTGGLTTFHGKEPRKILNRMESLMRTVGLTPQRDIIAKAIGGLVTLEHSHEHGRIVTGVYRIADDLDADGEYVVTPLGRVRSLAGTD